MNNEQWEAAIRLRKMREPHRLIYQIATHRYYPSLHAWEVAYARKIKKLGISPNQFGLGKRLLFAIRGS
jgi:hypothetical protein